jgi:hypothetical protein
MGPALCLDSDEFIMCCMLLLAVDGNGGALALVPYSDSHSSSPVTSSFTATRLLTFTQNFAAGVPWHAPEMSIAGQCELQP